MDDLIPIIAGLAGVVLVASAVPWKSMVAKLKPSQPEGQPEVPSVRGADDPPPEGAVDWVQKTEEVCGTASPETILRCLRDGLTLHQARGVRIAELQDMVVSE